MASKGIEKLVSEACKKDTLYFKGDRIEICKPNRKMVRLVILPDGTGIQGMLIQRWQKPSERKSK